jgi:hypothetical protein
MGKTRDRDVSKKPRITSLSKFIMLWAAATLVLLGIVYGYRSLTATPFVPEVTGQPSLAVDQNELDFGDVRFNRYVTAEFDVTNVGDVLLRFTRNPWVTVAEGC